MSSDLSYIDRLTQRYERSGTSLLIRTYLKDTMELVNEFEFTGVVPGAPIPIEVQAVARNILSDIARLGPAVSPIGSSIDASGSTVLVGAGGTEYPLNLLSNLSLGLASSVSLATGAEIPWDTVIQDDLAISDLVGNPTKLYIPDTVRMLRISYHVTYAYNATQGGTYRGINPTITSSISGAITPAGIRSVKEGILPFNNLTEADVVFSSRLIDIRDWAASRYLALKVQHDYGSAIGIYGVAGGKSTSCSIEMYE